MKNFKYIILGSLFISSVACAQGPVFTTLSQAGSDVYAGAKLEKKGHEPETYILKVNASDLTSSKISLPTELIHREVISIFPTEGSNLVVMTQRTVGQGDTPLFHSFDPKKKEWKKLSELSCPSFTKVKVQKSSLSFDCHETDAKGEERIKDKKVEFKDIVFKDPRDISLPVSQVQGQELKAELLGESFEWAQLKVGFNKKEKVFKP